jgi:hypothetical protein
MVFSQLSHGVPKDRAGPAAAQRASRRPHRGDVPTVSSRRPDSALPAPRPAPSQDLPAGRAVAAEQLHAPERADGSMPPRGRPLERPPKRNPFRSRASMPGAVRHQHATRHTSNQARGPGSQTSSPPSPPPIDVAYRSSACKRVGGHRQPRSDHSDMHYQRLGRHRHCIRAYRRLFAREPRAGVITESDVEPGRRCAGSPNRRFAVICLDSRLLRIYQPLCTAQASRPVPRLGYRTAGVHVSLPDEGALRSVVRNEQSHRRLGLARIRRIRIVK